MKECYSEYRKAEVKKPKKRLSNISVFLVIGGMALAAMVSSSLIDYGLKTTASIQTRVETDEVETELPEPDAERVKAFCNNHFVPVLEGILEHRISSSIIKGRFLFLESRVNERYGQPYKVEIVRRASKQGRRIDLGACFVTNGVPKIQFYVPAFVGLFAKLTNDPGNQLDSAVLLTLIHELDHLSTNAILWSGRPLDVKVRLQNEVDAWAETCEYAIRPLVESGFTLDPHHQGYHAMWMFVGRNKKHPLWEDFIREQYRY